MTTMLHTRRQALCLAQRTHIRQQRRFDSSEHSGHSSSTSSTDHGHHAEPTNESLGRGFYIGLALFPLTFAVYKFSRSSDDSGAESAQPFFTRIINSYSEYKEKWIQRNSLHTQMIEQAAHDRNLFQSSPGSKMVELKFPEIFNTGSPHNVPAGHSANLDELIAHYRKKNAEMEEAKLRKLDQSK
ncbi:hypothetical protein MMC20_001536 [Loxospora ochrophaea]|nr:hypothetical protein [Loxospora ochrophaea]